LLLLSFVAISIPVGRRVSRREEKRRTVAVGARVPDVFPVLVVYPGSGPGGMEARIVYHRALAPFLREHPDYSFSVRPDEARKLNGYLGTHPSLAEVTMSQEANPPFGAGRFDVQVLAGGRQAFKVEGTWDDDRVNIGWYETDGRSITPSRYVTYFGPGIVLGEVIPISAAITAALWLVIGLLYGRYFRIRR
jgi:hypothetical protein